jgi:membrane protein DedA with SNARE-associated domain
VAACETCRLPDIDPGLEPEDPTDPTDPTEGTRPADAAQPAERVGPTRSRAALVIVPIIALVIGNNLGNAFFPTLVTEKPLLLIALSPSNRNFVLVSNSVEPFWFYLVGTVRLLAPDPLFFLLGRWYGEAAIAWMERRTPTFGQLMRTLERWFGKASWPLVTAIPNNPVSLLAGAAGMAVVVFATLDVIGTIGRLVLLDWVGDIFSGPIDWLIELISQYRLPFLAVTIGLVGFTAIREWRAGTSQIEQLLELEEQLEEIDEQATED